MALSTLATVGSGMPVAAAMPGEVCTAPAPSAISRPRRTSTTTA